MSNKAYDIWKIVAMLITPASTFLISILKMVQNGVDPITLAISIISGLAELLGIVLKSSSGVYWKDKYIVKEDGTELDGDDDEEEDEIPDEDGGVE